MLNASAAQQDAPIASTSEELPASDPVTAPVEESASSDTAVEAEPVADIAPPVDQPLAVAMSDAPDDTPTLAIDPASFRGVFPGKTTLEEVEQSWGKGEAFARDDGSTGRFWKVEPFERVEVALDGGVVGSIRIKLVEPVPVKQLAEQLELTDVRTVSILDEQGVSVGEVFPERGVVISVKPGTQSAVALLLEPLDAEAFVLRSEGELEENVSLAKADLQYAVQIDPQHVRAQRMLLVLLTDQGRWQEALAVAESVAALDPADIWTQLKHASVLLALGRTDEARAKVEAVKSKSDIAPLVTAQDRKSTRLNSSHSSVSRMPSSA